MLRIAPNIQQQLQATIGWRPEPRCNSFWQPRQSHFPFLPERPTTAPESARRAIPSRSTCVGWGVLIADTPFKFKIGTAAK